MIPYLTVFFIYPTLIRLGCMTCIHVVLPSHGGIGLALPMVESALPSGRCARAKSL